MAVGAGKSREADPSRCRRHPKHRHEAGVCPFCLRDRLSRLSAAASASARAGTAKASATSSSSVASSSSSPCSSWEETVALSSLGQAPRPRRGSLGLLLRQEGAALAAAGRRAEQEQRQEEEERTAGKRGNNFWARLQQQLHNGSRNRRHGCSATAEKQSVAVAGPHKRAPVV